MDQLGRTVQALNRPGLDFLEFICEELNNEKYDWVPELRRVLTLWQQSGPNLKAMLAADPRLAQKLQKAYRTVYVPTEQGGAYSIPNPPLERDAASKALWRFIWITLSPEWQRLRLCPKCGKFFIRRTAKPSIYCSPRCASLASATRAIVNARKEEHADKLKKAGEAIDQWKTTRTKMPWKEWVARRYPDITAKFLTRAVNSGELQPPERKENPSAKTTK